MATQQDEGGVPFSVAHELQQFRLLELPPEIVELLEAPNPPLLSIKSQPVSTALSTPDSKPAYAVLCTPNKSFQLRQVQTSNSLFITQPTLEAHGNEIPTPATCAIASCSATLELHPANDSAETYLDQVLPVYDIVGGEVDAEENRKSKARIFSDIPLSDGQCEQAWISLIAFELSGSSYRPSTNTLGQAWTSLNAAALAEGIKLDSQFLTHDSAKLVEEEGYPMSLVVAIVRYLDNGDRDTKEQWSCLDRRKTVSFVGRTLLEAKSGKGDYLTSDFLDTWKDNLPEPWRNDAKLQMIADAYTLPSPNTVRAKSKVDATKTDFRTPRVAPSKGKWHERFAKNRKK